MVIPTGIVLGLVSGPDVWDSPSGTGWDRPDSPTLVSSAGGLLEERCPSTHTHQPVGLDCPSPGTRQLSRWLRLVTWLRAIPHRVVLLLWIAVIVVVASAWVAILFTGRSPRSLFAFVGGVLRGAAG